MEGAGERRKDGWSVLGSESGSENGWNRGKRVWFVERGLQGLDPAFPGKEGGSLGVVGGCEGGVGEEGFGREGEIAEGEGIKYDV
jgi:hypothetical protein